MEQLGKLGDETLPGVVDLRSKMYSILTVQPDGAPEDQERAQEGGDQRPASRVQGSAEEGSERRSQPSIALQLQRHGRHGQRLFVQSYVSL